MSRKFYWITISKDYLIGFGLLLLVIYILSLPSSYHLAELSMAVMSTPVKYDIVIDPGHGGIDSGGIGAGSVYEKDLVLDIALRMQRCLETAGLKVGLTRDSDTDVTHLATKAGTRHQRDLDGRFMAVHEGVLGISIHANIAKNAREQGALVFYLHDSYIDKQYAELVLKQIEKVQVLNYKHPVPRSNLLLLKAKLPVLLIEVGFLSNPEDLAKLTNSQFRQTLAEALSRGIVSFYNVYRSERTE